jgi:hypothetical protein
VKFEPGSLRNRHQTFDTIDLKVRFAVARDGRQQKQVGRALHGVALKENLAADPIRRPND